MKNLTGILFTVILLVGWNTMAISNNVRIASNVSLVEQNTADKFIYVQFDLAWDNSWRDTCNYDAAWVFIKFSNNNAWKQGYFSMEKTEHTITTNNGIIPAFLVGRTSINSVDQGVGVFIYRNAEGSGPINWQQVKLRWNYAQNGLTDAQAAAASIKVFAIEMVYVPQKGFNIGSGGTETNRFYKGGTSVSYYCTTISTFYPKNNETQFAYFGTWCPQMAANLSDIFTWNGVSSSITLSNTLSAYPKGYAAYFSMKYEISQEQYVEFLNSILPQQQISRVSAVVVNKYMSNTSNTPAPLFRNGVRCKVAPTTTLVGEWACDLNNNAIYNEADDGQNIACNYLSWDDALAYADWAGLRPMSELEYEKSCRGPFMLANEYAWGTANVDSVLTILNPGTANETPSSIAANAVFGNNPNVQGPMRVGCFANGSSAREGAGASYYGIMELSGNLWEQVIPVITGTAASSFNGAHGDGALYSNGNTDVVGWITGVSSGMRGGAWNTYKGRLRVSDRNDAVTTTTTRKEYNGFRAVRTAQ